MYWSEELKSIYEVDSEFDPSYGPSNEGQETRADHLRAFFSAEDFDRINQTAGDVAATGEPRVIEMPMKTAKGNDRWIRLFLECIL